MKSVLLESMFWNSLANSLQLPKSVATAATASTVILGILNVLALLQLPLFPRWYLLPWKKRKTLLQLKKRPASRA